jgi:hypothetical protein
MLAPVQAAGCRLQAAGCTVQAKLPAKNLLKKGALFFCFSRSALP